MDEYIDIKISNGEFAAYIARPTSGPAPVVIVLHEVFGVNADMRATCDQLADDGFIAICPELYWRQRPGLDLNLWSDNDWKIGLALNSAYDRDLGVEDIAQVISFARTIEGSSGKVGVMGFCIGGLMTFLTAARQKVDAAVAYHGGETDKYLAEAAAVTSPMIMHFGGRDEYISQEAQGRIREAFAKSPNVTIYAYPDSYHAFARNSGTHFDANAAALANERTRQFFETHLGLAHELI